ncbi:MAG TPA: Fur family transcriptional regulator [Candidatus Paceibacterota bacterium]|nr:Fur family transcriptional regulator [Candidatus Paceibacterota bacterium]
MRDLLKERGYKATPARIEILKILENVQKPLSVEQISHELKKKSVLMNEATIYRTLTSFEEGGLLRKIDMRKDSSYFEFNDYHHHHIVCKKCDRIEDFESREIEKALARIVDSSSLFKRISEHSLELFGLCTKCESGRI